MNRQASTTGDELPAKSFIRMIGLHRMKHSRDALMVLNSLSDSSLRRFNKTCSGYSDEVRKVIAQSINWEIALVRHDEDLEQFINYIVEAAPALTPFYIDPKHRFYTQEQCDHQIGEWSDVAYQGFCETPYPHHQDYIRGHALVFFVTGPSSPRRDVYADCPRLKWIGAHAIELGAHYQLLEERKNWDKRFLKQILELESKPLSSGVL